MSKKQTIKSIVKLAILLAFVIAFPGVGTVIVFGMLGWKLYKWAFKKA